MNRRRSPRPGPPPDTIVATVARVLLVMLTTTVVSLAAWAVLPLLWGWDAYTVTSGSMAPLVRPGDVVVAGPAVRPDRLRRGTVVVLAPFRNGGQPVTHRIVDRLTDGSYRTKGDANPCRIPGCPGPTRSSGGRGLWYRWSGCRSCGSERLRRSPA